MSARHSPGITWLGPTQRWQVRLFEGRRRTYSSYFSVRVYGSKAAALYAAERDRAAQLTRAARGELQSDVACTVDELLDRYLATKAHWQRPATLATRARSVRAALGTHDVRDLTAADVSALQATLLQRYAPKQVRHVMGCLRPALDIAVAAGLVRHNVARAVRLPQVPPRRGRFSVCEVDALLAAAEGSWLHPAIALMADCALRPGEMCALRWDDVAADGRSIHVQRSRATLRTTKTVAGDRRLPLTTRARLALSTWREHQSNLAWVFPALDGRPRPVCVQTFDEYFAALCGKAGVSRRRAYDLRRTAITVAVTYAGTGERPQNLQDVARWAGHSHISTTLACYTDAIGDDGRMADVMELGWRASRTTRGSAA